MAFWAISPFEKMDIRDLKQRENIFIHPYFSDATIAKKMKKG